MGWWQRHKEKKLQLEQQNIQPQQPQTNQNNDFKTKLGNIGERGYDLLLKNNTKIWQILNYHLYDYTTDFNPSSSFLWLNANGESFFPFDFIINGNCSKDKYFNVSLYPINTQPIVLIDVKTTGQNKQHFYRSRSEIDKINQLLEKYPNAVYFVCVVFVRYFDESNPFGDVANWKVRYFSLKDLEKLKVQEDNNGCLYFYDLNAKELP